MDTTSLIGTETNTSTLNTTDTVAPAPKPSKRKKIFKEGYLCLLSDKVRPEQYPADTRFRVKGILSTRKFEVIAHASEKGKVAIPVHINDMTLIPLKPKAKVVREAIETPTEVLAEITGEVELTED